MWCVFWTTSSLHTYICKKFQKKFYWNSSRCTYSSNIKRLLTIFMLLRTFLQHYSWIYAFWISKFYDYWRWLNVNNFFFIEFPLLSNVFLHHVSVTTFFSLVVALFTMRKLEHHEAQQCWWRQSRYW